MSGDYISKKNIDAIRLLLLGNLYNRCSSGGVSQAELQQHLLQLQSQGCLSECNVQDLVGMCNLKSSKIPASRAERQKLIPTCFKANVMNVGCLRNVLKATQSLLDRFDRDYSEDESKEQESEDTDDVCSICLEYETTLPNGAVDIPLTTPCGHYFHANCLQHSLANAMLRNAPLQCAQCRQSLDPSFIRAVQTGGSSLLVPNNTNATARIQQQLIEMFDRQGMITMFNRLNEWANQSDVNRIISTGIFVMLTMLVLAFLIPPEHRQASFAALMGGSYLRLRGLVSFGRQMMNLEDYTNNQINSVISNYEQTLKSMIEAINEGRITLEDAKRQMEDDNRRFEGMIRHIFNGYDNVIQEVLEDASISVTNRHERVRRITEDKALVTRRAERKISNMLQRNPPYAFDLAGRHG